MPPLSEGHISLAIRIEKLQQINTQNVEALYHFKEQMTLREDSAEEALPREKLMENAAESFEGCFKLPKVVGHAE